MFAPGGELHPAYARFAARLTFGLERPAIYHGDACLRSSGDRASAS